MHAIRGCCNFGFSRPLGGLILSALLFGTGLRGGAQTAGSPGRVAITSIVSSSEVVAEVQPAAFFNAVSKAELPDAPEPQKQNPIIQTDKPLVTAGEKSTVPANTNLPMAPMYSRVIPAGMATPQIHKWDKMELALRDTYSLSSFVDFLASAGWSHVTNGQPNYGTDSGAFGQRLGAAAIRDTSQGILSNGVFAVWFHQDPRYFALGKEHYSFGKRAVYALSRPFITRDSSDGHKEFNSSLIVGQAVGVGLSNLYYPESNRNFHDNMARFAGSIGGSGLSFALDEFTSDLLRAFRLRRLEKLMH